VTMRLCSGCQTKVPDKVRFCQACRAERATPTTDGLRLHTTGYDALLDRLRKSLRWQKLRALIVSRQPFCQRCQAAMTEIVDHIVPALVAIQQAQESGRWPYDKYAGYFLQTNLQGLCRSCHGVKTLEDKAHVGPWPSVVEAFDAAPKRTWTF
jgi:5-methylcytosine-specific restriction endonuclease McrA